MSIGFCTCGHSEDEHGEGFMAACEAQVDDPQLPDGYCPCIAYEAEDDE
jgi:hypothetical protein